MFMGEVIGARESLSVLSGTNTVPSVWSGAVGRACPMCRFYTVMKHALGVFWPGGAHGVAVADLFMPAHIEFSLNSLVGLWCGSREKPFGSFGGW